MSKLVLYRLMLIMIGSLLTLSSFAQLLLKIEPVANEDKTTVNSFSFKSAFKSKQELLSYIDKIPALLQAKGFISSSVDSTSEKDNTITAYVFWGRQYQWNELKIQPADWPLLTELGYSARSFSIADANTIAVLPQRIIQYYQNNGYPFAKVKWDSINLMNDKVNAILSVNKGPLYKMDSIRVFGSAKISKSFLAHYLDLPENGLYKQEILDKIEQKLSELPYLQQLQPWNLTMQSTGYVLNFYLAPKRSNQVDALIGLLPANQQNAGKLLLTVDAKLLLQNAFATGETIDFSWQQIQPKSPRLYLNYQQPYIFNSKFGLNAGFQLYKKDSAYLNIIGYIGVQYKLGDHQSATILIQSQRTNLLDVDTTSIKANKKLPDIIDLGINTIAIAYSFNNTDYRFNPKKGNELSIITSAGKKSIRRNNAITNIKDPSFNYNALYNSIDEQSYQLKLTAHAAHYFHLRARNVLKLAAQSGLLQSPDYFRNEMFQLGGYRLLRGFDEESIFANKYGVATLEYRYLVDKNSFFFGFTDLGWSNFKPGETNISHTYLGLGAGMAFELKQGIFNISYAVGKRDDTNLNFRQSKIHLGYTSFF